MKRHLSMLFGIVGLTAAIFASACGSVPPPPPVAVQGSPADLASLTGEWFGEYTNAATGRSGSITLSLKAGEGIAHGEVVMFANRAAAPYAAANERPRVDATQPSVRSLAIRFIAVEGGTISGTLEPYEDPEECHCILSTTFTGRVTGNVIEGTFLTYGGLGHSPEQGEWRVDRKG
ncbi:MAG TPA: hypothetical protein VLT87_18610 [Thermoanaerobaculia bacterium]|nr:hypothetical protein [Thermoanaerobaculia bacterium]